MANQSTVTLFIDDESQPVGEFLAPVAFELDTRKLVDGNHTLKVISKDHLGKEGIKLIPFTVRNGPAIAIEGLRKDEIVEGILPLMINAYGKGDQKTFTLHGSETPQSIPWWMIVLIILFAAWSLYFLVTSLAIKLY
ncbi:cytochrome C [Mucilaginibacter antarcticus]|uniref:Cytochrome C n=1 Tax=Mucilaginibacter antarcticus TaxID=1855725 RepID=A0ABW5XUS9_9SPHI